MPQAAWSTFAYPRRTRKRQLRKRGPSNFRTADFEVNSKTDEKTNFTNSRLINGLWIESLRLHLASDSSKPHRSSYDSLLREPPCQSSRAVQKVPRGLQ